MVSFLKLIRYNNLLMIALMQLFFRYGFLKYQNINLALNDWQYLLLILSTISIAGAGYIINNLMDQETDFINKPSSIVIGTIISEKLGYNLYIILNVLGVGLGFYLSNIIGKPNFAVIFVLTAVSLYLYATNFKQTLLIGNLLVSIITSLSILIIGIFDLYPILTLANKELISIYFEIILDYSLFAFFINFIREIVKDLEDINGDRILEMRTLPIVLGVNKTSKIVFVLSSVAVLLLLNYVHKYHFKNRLFLSTIYALIFLIAPLIYFSVNIFNAKTKINFHHLSIVLKFIMLFGILSVAATTLNIMYNA